MFVLKWRENVKTTVNVETFYNQNIIFITSDAEFLLDNMTMKPSDKIRTLKLNFNIKPTSESDKTSVQIHKSHVFYPGFSF